MPKTNITWIKSTRSMANGDCVQVAVLDGGQEG